MRVTLAAILLAGAAFCQDPRGAIVGRVTDASGAVIPEVEVRVTNRDTGVSAQAKANSAGNFNIPYLLPGFYTVTADMAGFKRFVREGIEVRVSETTEVNPTMEIGAVGEVVQVTAETPLLTTTDASQGTIVEERLVMELPLLGGNPVEFALLDPAIMNETDMRERRASMTNSSSQWSSMGGGTYKNEFQIDGVSNTFAMGNAQARVAFNPPPSSIGQFKIMTNPFDASVGATIGAVLNVATKGGTNRLQGEAHYYMRNAAFDTAMFFDNKNGTKRPVYQDNRFGLSLGGPLDIPKLYKGHSRTFWFYTWEMNPYTVPQAYTNTVPTAAEREGDFSALNALAPANNLARYQIYNPFTTRVSGTRFQRDPFPNNIIPKALFDSAGYKLANLYPLPNQWPNADGVDDYYNSGSKSKALEEYWVHLARFDHAFNQNHRVFLRVHYDFWEEVKNREFETPIQGLVLRRINRGIALDDVYLLTPNLVLNVRYGITQQEFPEYRISKGIDLASVGFKPGLTKLINPQVATLPRVNPDIFSDYSKWETGDGTNTSLTHNTNFTLSTQRGIHGLRWGGDFRTYRAFGNRYQYETAPDLVFARTYTLGPYSNSGSSPIGQDLASMLLGIATSGSMERPATFAVQNLYLGAFIQDDVRLTRKLTVNLGLRYEWESPMTERFDRLVTGFAHDTPSPIEEAARAAYAKSPMPGLPLENFRVRGGILFPGQTAAGRSPFRSEKNNFLPRVGLAYQLRRQTTIRAGYGIYYGSIGVNATAPLQYGFAQSTPIQPTMDNGQSYVALVSDPFPKGLLERAGRSGGLLTYLSQAISVHDLNRKQPYSQRWTFGVQELLPGQIMVETSYVGNRGTRLGVNHQINGTPGQYLSTSPVRDATTIAYLGEVFANPFYGLGPFSLPTISRANLVKPYPHFGNITVEQPVGYNWYHSLQVRAARRWTHGVSANVGYAFSKMMEATSFLNDTDPMPYETLSGSHRPHRLTMSGVWEIPVGGGRSFFKGMRGPFEGMFGGWQLSGVVTRQAGGPLGDWGNIIFNGDIHNIALPKDQRDVDRWFNIDAGFNKLSNQALANNIRTFPRRFAGVQADGQSKWDISVAKSFRLGERRNVRFRAQCFNLMNHPNFGAPTISVTSSSFGKITSTVGMPRTIQFALNLAF